MEFLSPTGQKVIRATAKEDKATPGYLLVELANISLADSKECEILHKCLSMRAKINDAVIQYKSMVVCKHIFNKGNPLLKRLFTQDATVLKNALQYRGRPHPLKGDKPNERVRVAAKAALAALYSQAKQVKSKKMEGFGGGRGIGSKSIGTDRQEHAGTVMGPATGNKYGRGIGSPGSRRIGKPRPEDQIRNAVRKGVQGLKKLGKEVEKVASSVANDFNKAVGIPVNSRHISGGFGSATDSSGYSSPQMSGTDRTVNQATSDGAFERHMITELVAPSGMSNEPDMGKLARFMQRCQTLSPAVVGPILEEKLRHGQFKVKCKAIVAVHSLLLADNLVPFHRYFKQHPHAIHDLLGDKASVAKKAQRVVETLDSIVLPDGDHENDNDNDEEPMDNGDGFDFTGGGDDNNDDDDMFANMNDGGDDMFADMGGDDAGGDMFEGMDGVDDSAGGGGFDFTEDSTAPAVPTASGADDFFGSASSAPAPAPAPASMDNLIGALDFSGGSGMGGMNNSGSMMNSNISSNSTGMMGLDFGSPSPAPAPNNSGSMMNSNTSSNSTGMMGLDFGSPSPAPAPAPQQAGGIDDIFGNMGMGSSPAQAPAPAPAPAPAEDPFAGLM